MNNRTLNLFGLPKGGKVYIAGPMSIYKEKCYNFERFFYWAAVLRASGYIPLNPAEMDCTRMFTGWTYNPDKYDEILEEDKRIVREEADAIFNLEDWEKSPGAIEENEVAEDKGIPYFNEVDFK